MPAALPWLCPPGAPIGDSSICPAPPLTSLVQASVAAAGSSREQVRVVSSKDLAGVIAELKEAHDAGLITDAEFGAAKAHAESVSKSSEASTFQVL